MGRKRKQHQPSSEELEDMGTKILESADKAMLEAIAANVQTLCDSFAQLKLPSDDPEYLKKLQTTEAQRNAIANQVGAIHVYSDPDKGETWLSVSINNRRDQATAIETARQMGEHFEAKVIRYD